MGRIKQLSVDLINKIAAGEVIERPANVVKELVENSVDAGATKIEISVSNDCRNFRIADNGSGIHPDDIQLAFIKHATSKLNDENGLFDIQTLGFRGEALASIISVAKVTCTTRTQDSEFGIKAVAENSAVNFSKTGCAPGTVMEVTDLFYNQPARLKFLKNPKTEFEYIKEYVISLALSHCDIGFNLKNNGSEILNTVPSNDPLVRISDLFSPDVVSGLRNVVGTDILSGIKITGFVSSPDFTRSSKKNIYTFVNSRTVKCPVFIKAVDTAYKNMLPQGRYPFVVLSLDINPEDIDVNAHPTKKEIRYKNPNQVFNFVQHSVSNALDSQTVNLSNITPVKSDNVIPIKQPAFDFKDKDALKIDDEEYKPFFPLKVKSSSSSELYKEPPSFQKRMQIDFSVCPKKDDPNIIGQFNNTYILIENDDSLEIIDQHIAEERFIYEQLSEQKQVASQLLIVSDVLDVESDDMLLLDEAKFGLEKFGYKIEKISDTQIIFKKIPQVLAKIEPSEILSELLKNIRISPDKNLDTIEEKILITTACKASVKAGDKLSLFQMEEIVKNWKSTKNPYTCPHGRPVSRKIPLKEIASFFLRNA